MSLSSTGENKRLLAAAPTHNITGVAVARSDLTFAISCCAISVCRRERIIEFMEILTKSGVAFAGVDDDGYGESCVY